MTLLAEDGETKSAEFQFGERATFHCSAYLSTELQLSEQLDGISITFHDSNGNKYQNGCLLYTDIDSDQTEFASAEKQCPAFESGKLEYSAAVTFLVTEQFVGDIAYTCQFHTRYRKHEKSPWVSAISGVSPAIRIVGRKKPSITLFPTKLDGFGGDIVTVECMSEMGYPAGMPVLLGNGNRSIQENIAKSEVSPEALIVNIRLTKALNGLSLICSNSKHPNEKIYSKPIAVKFLEPLIETVQTVDVRSDMTLDCSANVDTNGRVSYKWLGELVPPYSVQSTKPQLFVSHSSLTNYQLLKCVVTLVGDPHNVKWKFQYILNFLQPAASLQENGSSSRRDVTIPVTAALLVCGVVLLMAAAFIAHHYKTSRFSAKTQGKPYYQQRNSAAVNDYS